VFRPRLTILEDRAVPSFGWASAVGGDTGNAVATDAAGNVYMTGSYSGSFTPAGSSVALTSAGGSDIFVAKYARSGAFQWAVSLGGAQDDSGRGVAVDSAGNVFVVGNYRGSVAFGSTVLTMPAGNNQDAFVAKLDANGNALWAKNGLTTAGSTLVSGVSLLWTIPETHTSGARTAAPTGTWRNSISTARAFGATL
jgi:hypothetical protein